MKVFQQAMTHEAHGFVMDGIMGSQTWQALVTEALSGSSGTTGRAMLAPASRRNFRGSGTNVPGTA